ncbi:PREDICTED: PRUPE_8G238500 [Prunus dulcis]|uniref:PREDICTED: PRUPE_8G238500 n=1 Tax=Prunus dulcis TaxID=3755 RepID=A0A5E4EDQ8_PRUDU|nr:hypothetical protein L3X38_045123 [Prunus dulcis]VVA13937.1 PREDICTED: PRUPE_8G238500 [Prunus dulcis]
MRPTCVTMIHYTVQYREHAVRSTPVVPVGSTSRRGRRRKKERNLTPSDLSHLHLPLRRDFTDSFLLPIVIKRILADLNLIRFWGLRFGGSAVDCSVLVRILLSMFYLDLLWRRSRSSVVFSGNSNPKVAIF